MNNRYIRLAIALAAIIGRDLAAQACAGTWSKPVPLTRSDGRPVYIERGPIVDFGGRTLAVGVPTYFWLARDHMAPPGALKNAKDTADAVWSYTRAGAFIDDGGIAAGIPLVDSSYLRTSPRLVGRTDRAITVLWEVSDSVPTPTRQSPPTTRLERVTFDGQRWTAPEVIMHDYQIQYGTIPIAVRQGSRFDLTLVAAVVVDSAHHSAVRVSGLRAGRWVEADGPKSTPSGIGAISAPGDKTILMEMSPLGREPSGMYVVAGQWSGDSVAWEEPRFLEPISGSHHFFSWARLGGDSLVLVWDETSRDNSAQQLKTLLSIDGGFNWQRLDPVAGNWSGQELIVDSAGRAHIVYLSTDSSVLGAPGIILHSVLLNGRWSTPDVVTSGQSMTSPGAGGASGGRLMATWTDAVVTPLGLMPKTQVSYWTPTIPGRPCK